MKATKRTPATGARRGEKLGAKMAHPMMETITGTFTWVIVAVVAIGAFKIAVALALKKAKEKRREEGLEACPTCKRPFRRKR